MENKDLPLAGEKAKRAYVYSGFWSTNNYIRCSSATKFDPHHYGLSPAHKDAHRASGTQGG